MMTKLITRSLSCLALMLCFYEAVIAQKKPVDYDAFNKWPKIDNRKISDDGKYIMYTVSSKGSGSSLIVQSTQNSWRREIPRSNDGIFARDSRYFIFSSVGDSVGLLELGSDKIEYRQNATSYKVPMESSSEWIAILLNNAGRTLVLENVKTKLVKEISDVRDYVFSDNGQTLVLSKFSPDSNRHVNTLTWLNLSNFKNSLIWQGDFAANFVFDSGGRQLVFNVMKEDLTNVSIWYYSQGMEKATRLVDDSSKGMGGLTCSANSPAFFSPNGKKLYFSLMKVVEPDTVSKMNTNASVDVWRYKDDEPQSAQLKAVGSDRARTYQAVLNLGKENKIIRLEFDEYRYELTQLIGGGNGDYALSTKYNGSGFERYWRPSSRPDVYLISTLDGSKTLLKKQALTDYYISPNGKYVMWFDLTRRNWFTYNIGNKVITEITNKISPPLYNVENDYPRKAREYVNGAPTWIGNDYKVTSVAL